MKIAVVSPFRHRASRWSLGVLAIGWGVASQTCAEELVSVAMPAFESVAFSAHDADHDGYISADEFRSFRESRHVRGVERVRPRRGVPRHLSFEQVDSNQDGRIDLAELTSVLRDRASAVPVRSRARHGS
jgi:hypothetical protein